MSLIKKNIAANFVGNIWQAVIGLVFIPLYIKFIGIESWGLIGFFITLQMVFGLLDMGLSSTVNREMARLSVLPGKEQEMRDLLRTLEVLYWGIAALVVAVVFALSPYMAHHWLKAGELAPEVVERACLLMGFAIALQMPAGFYSGGLMGLQKQVLLNIINIAVSTLRAVGAVLILWLVSPTIQAYFLWQVLLGAVSVVLLVFFMWRSLPGSGAPAVFRKGLLRGVLRFTIGISGGTVLAVILSQMDKIVLSKMLPLEEFGYYSLATMVSISLGKLFTPIFFSVYPKLTQLVAVDDQSALKTFYHKSCQLMSVVILPVAVVLALFSHEVMSLWTHNPITAERTYLLVSVLVCGSALNGLMNTPYALQLAFGWTRLAVLKNIIAVPLLFPALVYMAGHYGAIGAASIWFILNLGYVLFEVPVMHLRVLSAEKWRWYLQDVGLPLLAAFATAGLCRLIMSGPLSAFATLVSLGLISLLTLGVTILSAPAIRAESYSYLRKAHLLK